MSRICIFLFFSLAIVLFQLQGSSSADQPIAKETYLVTKHLPDVPGKEGLVETVLLSPGEVVPAHRHNADVFAYVLDGSIVTQLKDGTPKTVHAGEVFYESPTDIHLDSRNASKTQPAKLLGLRPLKRLAVITELSTSGFTIELPGDLYLISVYSPVPGFHFLAQSLEVRDASVPQALPRKDPDFDLRLIQPTAVSGRVVDREVIPDFGGHLRAKDIR